MYFLVKIRNIQQSPIKQIFRNICTDSIKYKTSRQSKFINKFINKTKLNRDLFVQDINSSFDASTNNKLSVHTIRRMNVLNKIFMEHITDMMSTGEIEPAILDRNIEISHVKVTPDFKLLNVYWIDNNFAKSEKSDTEELLKKCAFQLRHELSQLQVIGIVPPIQFVKHKGIHLLKEVEHKLEILDFEKEHIPSPYPNCIHHTVTSFDINEDISNNEEEKFNVTIPVMKHNVFGLDHFHIMSKIKISLNKSNKILKKKIKNSLSESNVTDTQNLFDEKKQEELFAQFLNQRRKEQRRKIKERREVDDSIYNYEKENNDSNDFIDSDYNYSNDCEVFNRKQ